LGAARSLRAFSRAGEHDLALAAAEAAGPVDVEASHGVLTRLLGQGVAVDAVLGDLNPAERALFAAASPAKGASNRELRRAATALVALDARPVASIAAARLLLEIGAADEAAPLIRAARMQAPKMRAAAALDAKSLAAAGRVGDGRAVWSAFLKSNPKDGAARALAALFEYEQGDIEAASRLASRAPAEAVYRDPRLAEAAFRAASARGAATLSRAISAAHGFSSATEVAQALAKASLHREAATVARSALSENPKDDRAPAIYLTSMTATGGKAEAILMLEALVSRYPEALAAVETLERAKAPKAVTVEG
jgi:hypothetical protein